MFVCVYVHVFITCVYVCMNSRICVITQIPGKCESLELAQLVKRHFILL